MIDEKKFMQFMNSLEEAGAEHISFDGLRRFLEEYPKVGEWIPCEERMPEEPFGCIVTVLDTNSATLEEFENTLPYHVGYDGEQWNNEDGEKIPFEVIAWQKCPEPYRLRQKAVGEDYKQQIMNRFMKTK